MSKSKKGLNLWILILFIAILIGCSVFGYICVKKSNENVEKTSSSGLDSNLDEIENPNLVVINEEYAKSESLNNFTGIYSNNNHIIEISRIGIEAFCFKIDELDMYNLLAENEDTIALDNKSIDEEYSIRVTKNNDELKIEANSKEEDSILNKISGNFKREESDKIVWNGVYKKDETYIILSGVNELINISINAPEFIYANFTSDYSDEYIKIEEELFDDENNIDIKRDSKSITVEASSTDKDNYLNNISGKYEIICN